LSSRSALWKSLEVSPSAVVLVAGVIVVAGKGAGRYRRRKGREVTKDTTNKCLHMPSA
jgi:hypothetical protein